MKHYICIAVLLMTLGPSLAVPSGPAEDAYYGLLEDGTTIHLTWLDESYAEIKRTGQFVSLYGTTKNPLYAYCSGNYVNEKSVTFECKSTPNDTPSIIYGRENDPNYEKRAREVEKKLSLRSSYTMPVSYYVCIKGCGKSTSDVLILVTHIEKENPEYRFEK